MDNHYNPNQPRDRIGRWTDGSAPIPSYIRKKMEAAKPKEEKDEEEIIRRIQETEEQGGDSRTMHQENGNWTEERADLHDQILNEFLEKGQSSTGMAYHLGGAPANGKSTLVDSGLLGHPKNVVHVDPDAIKAKLPEYDIMNRNGVKTAASFVHEESSYLSKELIRRAENSNKDMLIDGVGDSGIEKIEAKVGSLRKKGFTSRADYVTLDTDLSLKLADARGRKTGRYVPETYIKAMNKEISTIVPKLVERNTFDELNLWDTNITGKPRLILSHKQGKTVIHDQHLYDNFLKKAK